MRAVTGVFLILASAGFAFGQAQVGSGEISGTVRDSDGALVANARVTVTRRRTGLERSSVTGRDGVFRFFLLNPDTYELRVEASRSAIQTRRPIDLRVGQSLRIDIDLTPAGIEQEIVVVGPAPAVESERTHQSDTLTAFQIENLPINGRHFLDFSLLTPGVTDANAWVDVTMPHRSHSGLSVAGQNGRANAVTIDGVDHIDTVVGAVRTTLGQAAVQEFQVNRARVSAEGGRARGGSIDIVSRSGSNAYGGSVFAFFRDQALDARNGLRTLDTDQPFSRLQSGFSLGGPLVRNESFFFLAYEGLRQRGSHPSTFVDSDRLFEPTASQEALLSGLETAADPSLQQLAGRLREVLTTSETTYPDTLRLLSENSGPFPHRRADNRASFRIDHRFSGRNQAFLRTHFADVDTRGGSTGALDISSRPSNFQIQDFGAVFGHSYFSGAHSVNDFRFQLASQEFNALPADALGPEIDIDRTARFGRDLLLPSLRNGNHFQIVDRFRFVSGDHEFNLGGDLQFLSLETRTGDLSGGRFTFSGAIPLSAVIDGEGGEGTSAAVASALGASGRTDLLPALSSAITPLQSFNLGRPVAYLQGFGDAAAHLNSTAVAAYFQDKIRVGTFFTVHLGLRYDVEIQSGALRRDWNNFSPRLGFAYSLDPVTVVRGGYGVYYSPVYPPAVFTQSVLGGSGASQLYLPLTGLPDLGISATSADVWARVESLGILGVRPIAASDLAPLGLTPGLTPPIVHRLAPGLVNPYSQQASFNVERGLSADAVAGIGYLWNKSSKLLRSRNTNLRITGSNAFGPTFGPIDPNLLQDNQIESSGSSTYHGLTATLSKRFADFHQLRVSYTYSKAIDDTTDFIPDLQAANQLDFRNERSLSAFDQRHRFVLAAVIQSPFERGLGVGKLLADVTVSPIVTVAGGHPFNLRLGFDANRDGNAMTDRPPAAGRNTGKGPGFASFDLRVAKSFAPGARRNFRIEAIGEVFNLFNRTNYSGVNNVVGTSLGDYHVEGDRSRSPGEPLGFTSAFSPRQIQLAVKIRF